MRLLWSEIQRELRGAAPAASLWWVQAEGRQAWEKQPRKPPPWPQPHHFTLTGAQFSSELARIYSSLRENKSHSMNSCLRRRAGFSHLPVELHLPPNHGPPQRVFCISAHTLRVPAVALLVGTGDKARCRRVPAAVRGSHGPEAEEATCPLTWKGSILPSPARAAAQENSSRLLSR